MSLSHKLLLFCSILTLQLSAQVCGKVTYGQNDGISLPYYNTFLDSKGGIWVDSRGGGVNYFDGKAWQNFTVEDGLLFSWSYGFREDKEGGIWIHHPYSKGTTRYLDGAFQQYVNLTSKQDTLLEGQKQFPPIYKEDPHMFIDPETRNLKAWRIDTTQQLWIHEFDYKTQSFDLEGEPFLSEQLLNQYGQMIKNPLIDSGLTRWEEDLCMYLAHSNKMETVLIFKNGATKKMPIGSGYHDDAFRLKIKNTKGYTYYKEEKGKLLISSFEEENWKEVEPPKLTRYGNNLEKVPMKFRSFHFGQNEKPSKGLFCTLWQIDDSNFPNLFVLAEHHPSSNEVIQTTIFNEVPSQIDRRTQFSKDKAGTYWYTNGHEVVRLFPDQLLLSVNDQGLPSNTWGITGGYGDRIWLSSWHHSASSEIGIHSFDGFNLNLPPDNLLPFCRFNDSGVRDKQGFNYFPNGAARISQMSDFGILKFNHAGEYEILCPNMQGFFLDWDRQGSLLYGTMNNGLWILPKGEKGIEHADWKKIDASKGLKLKNVLTALEDHKGRYWMGRGSQGLSVYLPDRDTIYNWVKEQHPENLGVQSMAEDQQGNLWFGTDKGLCFFENSTTITPDIKINELALVASDYLGESMIQVCKLYDEHTLIIGNKKGYFLLDLDAWYATPRQLLIHSYNSKNGNNAGHINQNGVWIDHNKDIWLTGNKGVVRFNPTLLTKDKAIPTIIIDSLEVGEKRFFAFDTKIKLESTERTLRINFSHAPNPLYYDNIHFRYRLSGDSDWSKLTNQTFIEYLNLSAGDYTFEVIAEKNGLRSAPKKLKFLIPKVLWRNPLFWTTIFAFLLAVALYYLKKEKEIYERELQIEKNKVQMANLKKEKLQVQAIVNQLNPHFINNALQWLQVRLDDNDDKEAVSVVAKLSENISSVFKNSRAEKAYHSLPNEMLLVKNYLFIQKRRFKNDLQYDISDFEHFEKYEDINIPLLMIQIHVENAVEHGIRNKKGGGKIKLTIEEETNMVLVKIEDTGVGRKAAHKIGSKGTQNGTKMLKELETIYNKQNELAISQVFEDDIFSDEMGNRYGTRMIIRLPKTYNYNL